VAVRFGLPVFILPASPKPEGVIDQFLLHGSSAKVLVRNSGNVHLSIRSLTLTARDRQGTVIHTQELTGWYLLPGVTRLHQFTLPIADCRRAATLETTVTTDQLTLHGRIDVDPSTCAP
jgi:P pilus assembly chaperone PapD